jgi:hypothetical protein
MSDHIKHVSDASFDTDVSCGHAVLVDYYGVVSMQDDRPDPR